MKMYKLKIGLMCLTITHFKYAIVFFTPTGCEVNIGLAYLYTRALTLMKQ